MSFDFNSAFAAAATGSAPTAKWTPTTEEAAFFGRLFRQLDVSKTGALQSAAVLPLLVKARLPQSVLREACFLSFS